MRYQSPSWVERLVGASCAVLTATIAIYAAARLIQAVWLTIILAALGVIGVAGLGTALRRRRQGW